MNRLLSEPLPATFQSGFNSPFAQLRYSRRIDRVPQGGQGSWPDLPPPANPTHPALHVVDEIGYLPRRLSVPTAGAEQIACFWKMAPSPFRARPATCRQQCHILAVPPPPKPPPGQSTPRVVRARLRKPVSGRHWPHRTSGSQRHAGVVTARWTSQVVGL